MCAPVTFWRTIGICLFFSLIASGPNIVVAGEEEDLEAMQKALNQEIMTRPFNPGDQAEIDKYVEDALKKNQIPKEYSGKNWKPGYTCANLRGYGYYPYRDCLHYYHYHGYYYQYF